MEKKYQPQLIEEVETLLGTPFFADERGYNIDDFSAESVGFKRFIYQAACRVLASARHDDRLIARPAPEQVRAWNENWTPTVRKMAEIAFQYQNDVIPLANNLSLVNGATEFMDNNWDSLVDRLHADQQVYMLDIVSSLQKPPRNVRYVDELGDTFDYTVQGTTIVAPTGFGKTRLIETCVRMFEPGKVPETSTRSSTPSRVLIVSPSVHLVEQTARELVDYLDGATVGVMHSDRKQPDADVVISTIEMFNAEFEAGRINGHPVSAVLVDEAHHLVEPQFRRTFVTQWRGPTLVFTATPAYDLDRDVRAIIPHTVEKTNILKSIEKGTLNDGQILTFFIDNHVYAKLLERYQVETTEAQKYAIIREVIDTLVLEFTQPLLQEGRRGIIFCEAGNEAHWANRLAERLQEMTLPDGRNVRAEAMHSYANNQLDVIERFRNGQLDVITTVDTGREGLDANFDFVIVNCNIVSRLRGHQIVGRGTRRSEQFPTTVYGQFSYRTEGVHSERLYSIEEAFGHNTIDVGSTISKRNAEGRRTARLSEPIDISAFPDIINDILERIDRKPIGEVFVGGVNRNRRQVTEGLISLPEILAGFSVTELRAKKLLRSEGFAWYGRLEGDEESGRRLVHYYTPEARDYLHEILPKGVQLTANEIANVYGLPRAAIAGAIQKLGLTGRPVSRGASGRPPICFNEEEQLAIATLAMTIPGTAEGDRRLQQVARELGVDATVAWKWSGASEEGRIDLAGVRYLTASEVAKAKAEYEKTPIAEPDEMTLIRMAEAAHLNHQVISRNMTDEDWLAAIPKRYRDGRNYLRTTHVWPPDVAADIIRRMQRFRSRPLEAHHLPSSALRKIVRNFGVTSPEVVAEHLAQGGFAPEEYIVAGTRSMSRCLSWSAIAHLVEVMGEGKGKTAIKLDFDRLPTGPDDLDPDKIRYAQEIQEQLLTSGERKKYDTIEE